MNIFHYRDRETPIHTMPAITKIFLTLLTSSLILNSSLLFTLVVALFLFLILIIIRVPIKEYSKEGIYFFFIVSIMSISRFISTNSIVSTIQISFAFISMIMVSIILLDTTPFNDIASTVGSFLSLFSPKLGYRIASTIELTLHMIPLFFDASSELRIARKARGQKLNRHIIGQLTEYVSSLFSHTFMKVERLEIALKARMFDPDRKREYIKIEAKDVLVLVIATFFIIILYLVL